MKTPHAALAFLLIVLPLGGFTQTIQRCEGTSQRVTYSNAECPPGTKSVRALPKAPPPSAEARAAAAAKLQRDKEQVKAQQTRPQQRPAAAETQQAALQQAADCGYLQAAIDSSRQLRSVLTTRPYYSTEDVDAADAKTAQLVAEYRRVCG